MSEAISGEIVPAERGGAPVRQVPQHVIDEYLSPGARKLVMRGIPPNTLAAYAWQWHLFRRWCEEYSGLPGKGRTFAPASEHTMIEYIHTWEDRPIHRRCHVPQCGHRPAPSTLWIWYSAVRFYHGMGTPPLPWEGGKKLALAMKAYGEDMREAGWKPVKAPRLYDPEIMAMVDAFDLENPKHLRDRALVLTNLYTAARASDLSTYRIDDVTRMPKGLQLSLNLSKTNKSGGRRGEIRRIFYDHKKPAYCGVTAVTEWRAWLAGQGITQGALFRPFNKYGQLVRGAPDAITYRMSPSKCTLAVKLAAIRAGLENADEVTCHALRRSQATRLRERGVDPIEIARAHGWVPGGSVLEYLEEAEGWSAEAPGASAAL
jgi:integrase